jgi:hypothetical protein
VCLHRKRKKEKEEKEEKEEKAHISFFFRVSLLTAPLLKRKRKPRNKNPLLPIKKPLTKL